MRRVTSVCPLDCPDTCSLAIDVEAAPDGQSERVVHIDGTDLNPLTAGYICGKVSVFTRHMYGEHRLLHPMVRDGAKGSGRFRRVSWDDALDLAVERIRATIDQHGAEAILPYAYGGSNGFLTHDSVDTRLFRRLGASRLLRTLCAAPSGAAVAAMYGTMPGVALEDYAHARLIILWGVNPSATGIHLVPIVQRAQRAGAKLVVIDPRRTPMAKRADLHLAIRPGTDLPVALAIIHWLFENGAADELFLARHATGAAELRARAAAWPLARAAEVAGIDVADLQRFAELYAGASPAVIRCGWGQERNRNGGSATSAILALPAVAGKLGVRGGGFTMSNGAAWGIDRGAAIAAPQPGTRAINMSQLGRALGSDLDPPIALLFVYNCNPVATAPDQEAVRAGLMREDLFTIVHEQVMTDTARHADLLLPATTFPEHHELRRGYGAMRMIEARPAVAPVGEARPNYELFAELVRRLGLAQPGDPVTPEALVAAVVGTSADPRAVAGELAHQGMASLPGGATPIQLVDVFPSTPDRKIVLVDAGLDAGAPAGLYGYIPDPATAAHPLSLISPAQGRTISSTLGQLVHAETPLEMHPDDARARGIGDGDPVRVFNQLGEVHCRARWSATMRPGVVCLPKGLWQHSTANGATANALVPDTLSDLGGGACFNDARVEVARLG